MAIGRTPIVSLCRYAGEYSIFAKLEVMNPSGSAKDRAALYMIDDAAARGLLLPGGMIIEPTSGNTGIALAMIAAARGYRCTIGMPDSMSIERQQMMKAQGAALILTPGALGMAGAIAEAKRICARTAGAFMPDQFENPANPLAHERTTGPEIWADMDGNIDYFVAGVGTGGTITGVGRYLKGQDPNVKVVAVEPHDSPVLSGGKASAHGIQGIGAGFVPGALDVSVIDEIIQVKTMDAMDVARQVASAEGISCGISSGAALWAAMQIALREGNKNARIAAVLPDGGNRYLSVEGFVLGAGRHGG